MAPERKPWMVERMDPRDIKIARLEAALKYTCELSAILATVETKPRSVETQRKLDRAWSQLIVTLPPEPRLDDWSSRTG
jgi:hypothetical protein